MKEKDIKGCATILTPKIFFDKPDSDSDSGNFYFLDSDSDSDSGGVGVGVKKIKISGVGVGVGFIEKNFGVKIGVKIVAHPLMSFSFIRKKIIYPINERIKYNTCHIIY